MIDARFINGALKDLRPKRASYLRFIPPNNVGSGLTSSPYWLCDMA